MHAVHEKQILGDLINIDKVAYKEVNFKSKLIEWTQKNKVSMEFKLLEHNKDKQGSPTFRFQVIMEGTGMWRKVMAIRRRKVSKKLLN